MNERTVTTTRRAAACLLLTGLLAVAAACGGGGGGKGGGGTVTEPPMTGITFTASGSGGAGSINLVNGTGSTTNTLVLDLQASQVQDLYGVAFTLSYPTSLLHFQGATEGTMLNGGGSVRTSLQAVESSPGTIVIGLSRIGQVAGVSGTGTLVTLRFSAAAAGTGTFAFSRDSAVDSLGNTIAGTTWNGGTVKVVL